ncbi:flagellar biosynthetic protein [Candidatus Photodesmus blepharus]|uniref:Flagellar biosynthetic protein FlhB n=1 Tax=Candidatus Photodesmus blepharonis TaxID=1179155 RepID=A0A084CNZ2_9GAMM|nr:flagellar biosynthesis protein FlhB [Candidatus Photodesmus blepharus]KEY91521.1 flagellar biosynthetic protein [Candidatus Photodesmus blepharus]
MKSSGEERTEEATPRHLQQARSKGQVARSKELSSVLVLIFGAISLIWFGDALAKALFRTMYRLFTLSHEEIFSLSKLNHIILNSLSDLFSQLILILITLFIASLVGTFGVGGLHFSARAAMPKLSKINPSIGFKRMIGLHTWVELIKSILKILIVSSIAFYLINTSKKELFQLNMGAFPKNIFDALSTLLNFTLLISCSLLPIVAIDVPFQILRHTAQLKMSKQEVKDEYRNTEGRPEIKGRIRLLQREMAQRRMMTNVLEADVIITNPKYFSVALRYKQNLDKTPILIAKGIDYMALRIKKVANENNIQIVPAPTLARSLYYTTELEEKIPDGLFTAVAQVLAYVFQLKQYRKHGGRRPTFKSENIPIPSNLRY